MRQRPSLPAESGPDAPEAAHNGGLSLLRSAARVALLTATLLAAAQADAAPAPAPKPVPEVPAPAPQQPAAPAAEPPPSPIEAAIAAFVLDAAEDEELPTELAQGVLKALQKLALEREILDPREVRYVLSREEDAASDVKLLRRRNRELKGAPLVSDSERFAPRTVVSDMLAFNRTYKQHLEAVLAVERVHEQEVQDAITETDFLYQLWDMVRDARCEYYYITVRRQALKRLLETVGPQGYYGGNLPPHVPLWRFQTID
jgi:hypothetical protein